MNDFLSDRGRELERSFFGPMEGGFQDEFRVEELRARMRALAFASGIEDDALLEKLVTLEIGTDTLAALSLIPLVAVAWADGAIEQNEIDAVLNAAEQVGMKKGDVNYKMLERWLAVEPDPRLFAAWKEYIAELSQSMSERGREALKKQLLGRARRVAAAAGGLLGLGSKISNSEQTALDELEKAFQ